MQLGFTDGEDRGLVGQMLYYARRAGYLEGALGLIAAGTTSVDPQVAAQRALDAVGPDVLQPGGEESDTTPARNGTPTECTVPPEWTSRPFYVDPPSGWAYGFPRLYDPAKDGDMVEWMIANGYPEKLARKGLPCTFTAAQ